MRHRATVANEIKLDERQHVERPFLDQLRDLGWTIIDCDRNQQPAQTHRSNFTQVVMVPVLREQLKIINPWIEDDQVDEAIKQLTASFPGTGLIQNNRHVLRLLLEGTSVPQNRMTGERSPTVRFIDFRQRDNNRFIAVCQLKVRILGTEHHIYPDIVLFLNGLPIVVIECKSPKVQDAIPEAIEQLLRYSDQRGAKGEGSPPLFYYNQFVVATCRQECKFGTITTHIDKLFYRWADPYPRTLNDLAHGGGSPNDQQRLAAGMLDRDNLLDLIQTFTVFSANDKGEIIKVVGRYQQFRAVKRAVKRLLDGQTQRERSGIVWHTQGSGKSLTMMFMVREMYRHPQLASWKIVFVTDRTQLEDQLQETSYSIGFTVTAADNIDRLKELIATDSSDLVMAMIHKFREAELRETFPQLNTSPRILVMVDEAHRSQYAMLGANLDRAMPKAARIAYTGTPIDKTEAVFGDYIDTYTMRQSIEDKVTLEIVYEGRTHDAEIPEPAAMDATFQDVFSEYNVQERLAILGQGSRDAYLESRVTIEAKAKDMVAHYVTHVFPNGYKAQIVATSREAAVRYKEYVDTALADTVAALERDNPQRLDIRRLTALGTDVVISGSHNDEAHLKPFTDPDKHKTTIRSFKLPFDAEENGVKGDTGIIIVTSMLLTGFDAPIEQVIYLDKLIVDHTLLQAIARVNRVAGSAKEKGYVVDYVGVGHHLKRALANYEEREQTEIIRALSFPDDELRALRAADDVIMQWLRRHGLSDLTDHDAFFDLFYDEDLRFEYISLFRTYTKCLDSMFPSREALGFLPNYQRLAEINALAAKHLRDARLSMKGIPPKLRKITDAYLESRGIAVKVEPISILDKDFQKDVQQRARTKTKAAEVEHAIRHHLDIALADDPDLQASFAQALARIFEEFHDNWNQIYDELEKLRQSIIRASQEPTYGLHRKKQMPIFRMLKKELYGEGVLDDDAVALLVALTQDLFDEIARELRLAGFWESIPARNKLKADLQKTLLQAEYTPIPGIIRNRLRIISRLVEIAEKNNDIILYAP